VSAPPFMQLYVSDYLGATRAFTAEQHGAYMLLLMSMWNAEGSLRNDPKMLARLACCTPSRWAKVGPAVMEKFTLQGDRITHARLGRELKKAQEKSIKRAIVGSLGGAAKALKDKEPVLAIATGLPYHSPEPEPDTQEAKASLVTRTRAVKRCPVDWKPDDGVLEVGRKSGLSPGEIDRELETLRDYEFRSAKTDWNATARNWLRTAGTRNAKSARPERITSIAGLNERDRRAGGIVGLLD